MAAFTVCALLSGCASEPATPAPEVWLQDKPQVLQAMQDNRTREQQLAARIAGLEKQLGELTTTAGQQQAELAAASEQIAGMKKQIRKLQRTAARLNASRNITRQKLDKKIEKIAQAIKPAEPADQTAHREEEKDHYTAAYLALKSGRYDEAIDKFRELLKTYPKGGYSDQAYYWLGESYLAQNNLERAVGNLEWMIAQYPESTKHAAGMLRLSIAYHEQQRFSEEQAMLKRLIEEHSESPAAEQARRRLASASDRPAR